MLLWFDCQFSTSLIVFVLVAIVGIEVPSILSANFSRQLHNVAVGVKTLKSLDFLGQTYQQHHFFQMLTQRLQSLYFVGLVVGMDYQLDRLTTGIAQLCTQGVFVVTAEIGDGFFKMHRQIQRITGVGKCS